MPSARWITMFFALAAAASVWVFLGASPLVGADHLLQRDRAKTQKATPDFERLVLPDPLGLAANDPPEAFALLATYEANQLRKSRSTAELRLHPQLQLALDDATRRFSLEIANQDLSPVFEEIKNQVPSIHELAINLIFASNRASLLEELRRWPDLDRRQHTHYAIHLFPSGSADQDLGCMAVLAQELPRLRLPYRPTGDQVFFDVCQRCDQGHGVSLGQESGGTLIFNCPHCREPYNILAMDSSGNWRRANQFLEEAITPTKPADGLRTVMELWRDVEAQCRYRRDAQRISGSDSWDLPAETLRVGSGDCEDMSLLLAQRLRQHGFPARVALGKHGNEGHAWCVVQVSGVTYILESTRRHLHRLQRPPTVDEVGRDYQPDYLFDEERVFFKEYSGWTNKYWSDEVWAGIAEG